MILAAVAVALAAVPATGQPYDERYDDDRYGTGTTYDDPSSAAGRFSIRTGLGFTASPESFLLGFEGEYAFTDHVAAGAQVHLGIDNEGTIVSPVAFGRFRTDLGSIDTSLERLEPFLQLGLGFTYWDRDRPAPQRGSQDDLEFLLNFGFGAEYNVTDHVAVGSHMGFNVVPSEIYDDRFYFTWEVVTLRYRF